MNSSIDPNSGGFIKRPAKNDKTNTGVLVSQGCLNKIPQSQGLNNRNLFSASSGSWKSNIKHGQVLGF